MYFQLFHHHRHHQQFNYTTMKLNPITTIIATGISALIAFAFYSYVAADNKTMLTVGVFAFLLFTSIGFLSLSLEQPRTTTLVKTISAIFFSLALVLHIVAAFLKFTQPTYIIFVGLLALVYLLITYSIARQKQ